MTVATAGSVRTAAWLRRYFQMRDPQDWVNDLTTSFMPPTRTGDVFYVDPTDGSDSNDGTGQDRAFATLQAGINACTSGNGDVIVRMPGTENTTSAITVNKRGITIIASDLGANPMQQGEVSFSTYPAASYDSGPTIIIQESCAIIGLEFVTRNTSASGRSDDCSDSAGAMCFDGEGGSYNGGFCYIANCRFADWWGNDYGIEFQAGAYNLIHNCVFEGFDAGVIFDGTSSNNPDYNHIIACHFVDNTNGIEHRGDVTPQNFLYKDNVFIDYTDAIDFNQAAGPTCNGLVAGNWYETATDAATYDCTVAQAQALGANFSGNNYSE